MGWPAGSPRDPSRKVLAGLTDCVRSFFSIGLALGLGGVVLVAGCSESRPPAAVPPQVRLLNPRPLITLDAADYQSTLEAIREVRLASEIAGRITALPVYEGQPVKQGQPLFRLDQLQQQATVNANAAEARKTYAKIYNSMSVMPCSQMPRFGHSKFLSEEQIKDVVAYLYDPESPVNK